MAEINDLTCKGDALIQGDATINGAVNNKQLDTNSGALIIEVCKKLDLSAVGNSVTITIPSGYVGTLTFGTAFSDIFYSTNNGSSTSFSTNPIVSVSYTNASSGSTATATATINPNTSNYIGLSMAVSGTITISVTTAGVGTNVWCTFFGTLYCSK